MSDDFWGDASLGSSGWDDAASSWGPSFEPSYEPTTDYSADWSNIFTDPNFVSTNFGSEPFDWSNDVDWTEAFTNSDYFGNNYDPLTDPNASLESILGYTDQYLGDNDLYSLLNGEGFGEGSSLMSISRDNALGELLSRDPVGEEGASGGSKDAISKLLKLLGEGARSPLGQLAQGLLGIATKRQDRKNQVATRDDARNYAAANSQQALAPHRTGLENFNGAARDPYSYVQPAPTIERLP